MLNFTALVGLDYDYDYDDDDDDEDYEVDDNDDEDYEVEDYDNEDYEAENFDQKKEFRKKGKNFYFILKVGILSIHCIC